VPSAAHPASRKNALASRHERNVATGRTVPSPARAGPSVHRATHRCCAPRHPLTKDRLRPKNTRHAEKPVSQAAIDLRATALETRVSSAQTGPAAPRQDHAGARQPHLAVSLPRDLVRNPTPMRRCLALTRESRKSGESPICLIPPRRGYFLAALIRSPGERRVGKRRTT
jgi:hypothetical protein